MAHYAMTYVLGRSINVSCFIRDKKHGEQGTSSYRLKVLSMAILSATTDVELSAS